MKKLILFFVVILIALGVIYKMDIKPEVKDVIKPVSVNAQQQQPVKAAPAPANAIPSQNVSE